MEYFKGDFVLIRGDIKKITSIDEDCVTADCTDYSLNDIAPIPIKSQLSAKFVIRKCIGMASCFDNGKVRVEKPTIGVNSNDETFATEADLHFKNKEENSYWFIRNINNDFLSKNHIIFVHELQNYIKSLNIGFSIEYKY